MKNTTRPFAASITKRTLSAVPKTGPIAVREVGARDGLQNLPFVSTENKLKFLRLLAQAHPAGDIEAASFVNPKRVPQFQDVVDVAQGINAREDAERFSYLVLNEKGVERAIALGARKLAIVDTPSEAFAQKNMGISLADLYVRNRDMLARARGAGIPVDVYLSMCFQCPDEGVVPLDNVTNIARDYAMISNVASLTISDTTGLGTTEMVRKIFEELRFIGKPLGGHFHDTYGMALANVLAAVESGAVTIDASVAGLGGCNFVKGAAGNVATEDVVFALESMGRDTGVDLFKLIEASTFISDVIGKSPASRVYHALKDKSSEQIQGLIAQRRPAHLVRMEAEKGQIVI